MNHKSYSEEIQQKLLEAELENEQEIIDSFKRVVKGKNITKKDLNIVDRVMSEQSKIGEATSIEKTLDSLQKENVAKTEKVNKSRKRLRKKRVDQDRLRKQRHIRHEKKLNQEREMEM